MCKDFCLALPVIFHFKLWKPIFSKALSSTIYTNLGELTLMGDGLFRLYFNSSELTCLG
jgi:hypothetical protein